MSNLKLKPLITFDKNNIGTVDKEEVLFRMKEHKLSHESFLTHDEFRDETFAAAIEEAIQYGEDNGIGDKEGAVISVDNIYLGGTTLGHIQINEDWKVTGSVTYKSGSLMDKVLSRGNDLFVKYNILDGTTDENEIEENLEDF